MLQKAIPVLPTININHSIDFYVLKLGFKAINYGNYAILHFKNIEIHLSMNCDQPAGTNTACLILVENIEDLYTSYSAKGLIDVKGKLADRPWGIKEFTIIDNNNNQIRFGKKC